MIESTERGKRVQGGERNCGKEREMNGDGKNAIIEEQ